MLPLIDAERAWAYAMQLKSEANTEPRKRFHLISRLRKAVQHANTLDRLCNDSGLFDARTKLDVEVGTSYSPVSVRLSVTSQCSIEMAE